MRHFYQNYFQICHWFARIISARPCFSLQNYIPQNYLKTKLFNTDADRIDAPKWIWNPNQKGDLKWKTTYKVRQKQFNILNDEYWKFVIYNNHSFATTNFAEYCLDIPFVKINSCALLCSSQYSIYVETKWLVCMLINLPKVSSLPILLAIKPVQVENIS